MAIPTLEKVLGIEEGYFKQPHLKEYNWWTGTEGQRKAGLILDMLYVKAMKEQSIKAAALFLAYSLGLPRQHLDIKTLSVSITADELRAAVVQAKQLQDAILGGTQKLGVTNTDTKLCLESAGGMRPESAE